MADSAPPTPSDSPPVPEDSAKPRGKLHRIFNPYTMSALVVANGLWAYNIFRRINRVLSARYANPVYQIRRPSSLANRLAAVKYFFIGGSVVPGVFLAYVLYAKHSGRPLGPRAKGDSEPSALIAQLNGSLARYSSNASSRLEGVADAVRAHVPEASLRGMGADLRRDVAKLR